LILPIATNKLTILNCPPFPVIATTKRMP
jgi:hypothetical protein